jgi:hypothetical protein
MVASQFLIQILPNIAVQNVTLLHRIHEDITLEGCYSVFPGKYWWGTLKQVAILCTSSPTLHSQSSHH